MKKGSVFGYLIAFLLAAGVITTLLVVLMVNLEPSDGVNSPVPTTELPTKPISAPTTTRQPITTETTHSPLPSPAPRLVFDLMLDFKPAFSTILENKQKSISTGAPAFDLGLSSFTGDQNMKDTTYSINDVQNFQLNRNITLNMLTDELVWPNEVEQVPDGIFDARVWSVASAFFLPGKDNGSIGLIDMTDKQNTAVVHISPFDDDKVWFYHRVLWFDMNEDGHMDAVTARAYGTGASATEAQLVWLENPGFKYLTPNWKLHVIHEGGEDISFQIHELPLIDGSTTPVVISAGFWSSELGLTWSDTNDWLNLTSIQHIAVDNFGWYFDLEVVDLNLDGNVDILATTWSQLGDPGALLAYQIPQNWQVDTWTRHILQEDYTAFIRPGLGSPGTAMAFWPDANTKKAGFKPWIALSGDDNGEAYIVTPNSELANDWNYTQTTIYSNADGPVGKIAVGDVDGDGYTEVFLPSYEEEFLRIMTYLP